MSKAPKMSTNTSSIPLSSNHRTPVPAESTQSALKHAWRRSGKRVSLKQFAREHAEGSTWLRNKKLAS